MNKFLLYAMTFIIGFFECLIVLTLMLIQATIATTKYLLWAFRVTNKKYRIVKYKSDGKTEVIYK